MDDDLKMQGHWRSACLERQKSAKSEFDDVEVVRTGQCRTWVGKVGGESESGRNANGTDFRASDSCPQQVGVSTEPSPSALYAEVKVWRATALTPMDEGARLQRGNQSR